MLTLEWFLTLVQVAFAASAFSITLTRARALKGVREAVKERSDFWGHLLNCPYCISHWFAIVFAWWFPFKGLLWYVVNVFSIVGVAALITGLAINWFHMGDKIIEEQEDEIDSLRAENVNLRLALSDIAEDN